MIGGDAAVAELLRRERDEARAKLDALLYQYKACHAEKDEARAIARRLADDWRKQMLDDLETVIEPARIKAAIYRQAPALRDFDTLPWAKDTSS